MNSFLQHKKEAYWFYRFLSIGYDKYINPFFWTERMREQALELAQLNDPDLRVIDVGSGTGFTTQGIVKRVNKRNVLCVDQSPHQIAKAIDKKDLNGCTFQIGDAECLSFGNNCFDRYVSAGSIEYWPEPQQGIREAYRIIKPGGIALVIGPIEPKNRIVRFIASTMMLFPRESKYRAWFEEVGFRDICVQYLRPLWYRGKGEYAIAIAGRKIQPDISCDVPSFREVKKGEEKMTLRSWLRVLIGSLAGFLFIPFALAGHFRDIFSQRENAKDPSQERLSNHQLLALFMILGTIAALIWVVNKRLHS